MTFNALRFTVSTAVISLGVVLFGGAGGIEFGPPFLAAVASGISSWFVATLLFFFVLRRGSAHRIIPTGNSYPFWAIFLASLFLDEGITPMIPVSAVLVFSGTFLLARRREKEGDRWRFGVPIASVVAFIWGANAILNKFALNEGMIMSSLILIKVVSATVLFWMVFGLRSLGRRPKLDRRTVGLSTLAGMVSIPVGSLLYISALSMENASTLAPVTGATVFFGFLLSVAVLEERPTRKAVLGMASIFLGILLMVF